MSSKYNFVLTDYLDRALKALSGVVSGISNVISNLKGMAFIDDADGKVYGRFNNEWTEVPVGDYLSKTANSEFEGTGDRFFGIGTQGQPIEKTPEYVTENDIIQASEVFNEVAFLGVKTINNQSIVGSGNLSIQTYWEDDEIPKLGYGYLYNYYTLVDGVNNHNGFLLGMSIPTNNDFNELFTYLTTTYNDITLSNISNYLKSSRISPLNIEPRWRDGTTTGDNTYNFSVLPSGICNESGVFSLIGDECRLWCYDEFDANNAYANIFQYGSGVVVNDYFLKTNGYSIRCVKEDLSVNPDGTILGTIKDFDGNVYEIVKIGNQAWTVQNLKTTKYLDGTEIPNETTSDWSTQTTGAYRIYSDDINLVGLYYSDEFTKYNIKPIDNKKVFVKHIEGGGVETQILAASTKESPADADVFGYVDAVSSLLQKFTWANLKAALKGYFDTVYKIVFRDKNNDTLPYRENATGGEFVEYTDDSVNSAVKVDIKPEKLEATEEFESEVIQLESTEEAGTEPFLNPDWNEEDVNSIAFIRNKPEIPEPAPQLWEQVEVPKIGYGFLYNWYSANESSGYGGFISGMRVPDTDDWDVFITYIGSTETGGGKLKSIRTSPDADPSWDTPNTGASDEYIFSAFPSGEKTSSFMNIKQRFSAWGNNIVGEDDYAYVFTLFHNSAFINPSSAPAHSGIAVRCVRELLEGEESLPDGIIGVAYDFNNNAYDLVKIGTQVWTRQNLMCSNYADGTEIPYQTGSWYGISYGVRCIYNDDEDLPGLRNPDEFTESDEIQPTDERWVDAKHIRNLPSPDIEIIDILYADLITKINAEDLKIGTSYRITDY